MLARTLEIEDKILKDVLIVSPREAGEGPAAIRIERWAYGAGSIENIQTLAVFYEAVFLPGHPDEDEPTTAYIEGLIRTDVHAVDAAGDTLEVGGNYRFVRARARLSIEDSSLVD